MTVAELIAELNKVENKNREVVFSTPDGYVVVDGVNECEWSRGLVLSANGQT